MSLLRIIAFRAKWVAHKNIACSFCYFSPVFCLCELSVGLCESVLLRAKVCINCIVPMLDFWGRRSFITTGFRQIGFLNHMDTLDQSA